MELPQSIAEAARRLRAGELTCAQLVRGFLERIEALQPRLNAFLAVGVDAALERAEALDAELRAGRDRGPLHGMPIACKDCLDTAGVRTTMGSRLFAERVPAEDAEVVRRLLAAGAVLLGKTNMNEFAAGTSGKNAFYGDTQNPLAPERSPGGSSSGSAAAVAAGMALGAIGTDTGGSIRIPAACTGLVGLRPTLGRVSVQGCFPRAPSFDVVGPLARTARDCALLFGAMAGEAASDAAADVAGMRIGVIRDFSFRGVDGEVEQAVRSALRCLAERGASVREIAVAGVADEATAAAFMDIMLYEFHGILAPHWRDRADRDRCFGPVVRANLERGAKIGEGAYRAALAARARATAAIREAFSAVDVLATPVLARTAPRLDAAPEAFDAQRHFMSPFSLAGLPAVSVPCGFAADGLPVGLQLVADRDREALLLRAASACETMAQRP